jgi:hypothetical protein
VLAHVSCIRVDEELHVLVGTVSPIQLVQLILNQFQSRRQKLTIRRYVPECPAKRADKITIPWVSTSYRPTEEENVDHNKPYYFHAKLRIREQNDE